MAESSHGLEELAIALGRVAIAWGTMQDRLGHLFSAVMFGSLSEVGLAAWHAHNSDRAQRNMLAAAANAALGHRPALRKRIVNLANQVTQMSNLRNDLIHGSYATLHREDGTIVAIPDSYYGNSGATNLAQRYEDGTLLEVIEAFIGEINRATAKCEEGFQCLVDPERVPSRGKSDRRKKAPENSPQERSRQKTGR